MQRVSTVFQYLLIFPSVASPAVNISSIYDPARWAAVRSTLEARNYQRPNVPGALGVDVSSFVSIDQWACVRSGEHEEKTWAQMALCVPRRSCVLCGSCSV